MTIRRPPSTTSWPPSDHSQSEHIGHLRERVRALEQINETERQMTIERLAAQSSRLSGIDARLAKGDERMNGLQTRLLELDHETKRAAEAMAPLAALGERVSAVEARLAATRKGIQYAAAILLFGLTLSGKITVNEASKVLGSAAGLLR
jgi:chromosome segregation ATPase